MIGNPDRRMLYESAIRALGEDAAAVLMSYLMPFDWSQIVTKDYIDARFDTVDARFDAIIGSSDSKFGAMDSKFDAMNSKMDSMRIELLAVVKQSAEHQTKTLVASVVAINASVVGTALAFAHWLK